MPNPYEPPIDRGVSSAAGPASVTQELGSNPAKRLLVTCSLLCLVGALLTLPLGPRRVLFLQLLSCLVFTLFLASSLWIASRKYDYVSKTLTILWPLCAAGAILFVITFVDPISFPPTAPNIPGLLIIAAIFILLGSIVRIGWLSSTTTNARK